MKKLVIFLFMFLLIGSSTAFGGEALYFVDKVYSTDRMEEALGYELFDLSVTSTDSPDEFSTLMTVGEWDLVVCACQWDSGISSFVTFENTGIEDYVNEGGKAIFCDWVTDGDTEFYNFFGATTTGNENETSMTVASGDLAEGLASNPQILTNSSWGGIIFSVGLSPLTSEDIEVATFDNGDAAIIISNGGRTIINGFLTDTLSDDILIRNEIELLLSPTTEENDSGGCNIAAFPGIGFLLLVPLMFLSGRRK